jgi:hypothetical protein
MDMESGLPSGQVNRWGIQAFNNGIKLVSHCRVSSNAVMQDVDPLDLVDGGDGELDGLIATIFDEVEVPASRSAGFYLNLLKEIHSKHALATRLQFLTGLHSTSMWIKNLGKWLKCKIFRTKNKRVYSAANYSDCHLKNLHDLAP